MNRGGGELGYSPDEYIAGVYAGSAVALYEFQQGNGYIQSSNTGVHLELSSWRTRSRRG